MLIGMIGLVSSALCYQESYNVTNQVGTDGSCNLNYTGNYTASGGGTWVTSNSLYDGNWSSNGGCSTSGFCISTIVYNKPINSLNTSFWTTRAGSNIPNNNYSNLTLPISCWNFNSNYIKLEYQQKAVAPSNVKYYCYNSSGLVFLYNETLGKQQYEEAMWWDIPVTTNSCNYSGTGNWLIQSSDYCNISVNTALGGNNITINGSGITNLLANITGFNKVWIFGINSWQKSLNSGLVGYWNMEGNFNDTLGVNNLTKSASWNTITGKVGNALNMKSDSGRVEQTLIGNSFNFTKSNGFTINIWQMQTGNCPLSCINYIPYISAGNNYIITYTDGGATQLKSAGTQIDYTAPAINTWVMHTLAWNGTTLCYYKNNDQINCSSATNIALADWTGQDIIIGGQSVNVNISIDELGIWNRSLTTVEINRLYNSDKGVTNPQSINGGLAEVFCKGGCFKK